MQLSGVIPSVSPSMAPQQQTSCCRFAAVGPAERRYRSTAARRTAARRAAGECGYCHVVSVRRKLNTDLFAQRCKILTALATYRPMQKQHCDRKKTLYDCTAVPCTISKSVKDGLKLLCFASSVDQACLHLLVSTNKSVCLSHWWKCPSSNCIRSTLVSRYVLCSCNNSQLHRVTMTQFRSISMPAGFRRHLVGKTLRNVCYSDCT